MGEVGLGGGMGRGRGSYGGSKGWTLFKMSMGIFQEIMEGKGKIKAMEKSNLMLSD